MTTRADRIQLAVVIAALGLVAMIGAAFAGAASAPPPHTGFEVPEAAPTPPIDTTDATQPPPKRFSVIGVIVGIREQRLAIRVKSREQPVLVALRPGTVVRLNRQAATLEDFKVNDKVVVVGRPGPRGNVILATGVNVMRSPDPTG
jgi:hypothetical protein